MAKETNLLKKHTFKNCLGKNEIYMKNMLNICNIKFSFDKKLNLQ